MGGEVENWGREGGTTFSGSEVEKVREDQIYWSLPRQQGENTGLSFRSFRTFPSICTYHCSRTYVRTCKTVNHSTQQFDPSRKEPASMGGFISTWAGNGTWGPNSRQLCMWPSSSDPLPQILEPITCISPLSERDLIHKFKLGEYEEDEMKGSSAQKRLYCGPV